MEAFKILTEVLIGLRWPVSFSLEPLQKLLDLVMSTIGGKEVLEEEKIMKLCKSIVNHGIESLVNEDRVAKTARYSSTKEWLLECMEADSGRV